MRKFIRKQLIKKGYDIIKLSQFNAWPADFEDSHRKIIEKVKPYTMTSRESVFGLIEAVKYLSKNQITGDVVECGVWRGGSMLAIAEVLMDLNDTTRKLYLYDTFEGMPKPTEHDKNFADKKAEDMLLPNADKNEDWIWAYSPLDTVKQTMLLSNYPQNKLHFIKGKVEDTIPSVMPENICLLRLDTDWYESTKHELVHLFPRLVKGGVLIIDDYGFWKGARQAVDEYLAEIKVQILLVRLDATGRIAIKLN